MTTRKRIAVLGGGMAGLAAAWELSKPDRADEIESVTVYQRGWRLGGKGASSRGVHGRVEEHGLHVWLGYYENAFRLLRECYEELDRPRTDPAAPIKEWRDGFVAASRIGLGERDGEGWLPWTARFTESDAVPGDPDAGTAPMTVAELTARSLSLLRDFAASLPPRPDEHVRAPVVLTSSPVPPSVPSMTARQADRIVRDGALFALTAALE